MRNDQRAPKAFRRPEPYDYSPMMHLKTHAKVSRTATRAPTKEWHEVLEVLKRDSEQHDEDESLSQFRQLVMHTSMALGTVRQLLDIVGPASHRIVNPEEALQLAVLSCYVFDWIELNLQFGPITRDSEYGIEPLTARNIGDILKEPGLEVNPVRPVKSGCLYGIVDDLTAAIHRSYSDYSSVWVPALPTNSWAAQMEENVGPAPRSREGVEACLAQLRCMTEYASVIQHYPFEWIRLGDQKRVSLSPDTLVGYAQRPLKMFIGNRGFRLLTRHAKSIGFEKSPLTGFANGYCSSWPTFGMFKSHMNSNVRCELREEDVLDMTRVREILKLHQKNVIVVHEQPIVPPKTTTVPVVTHSVIESPQRHDEAAPATVSAPIAHTTTTTAVAAPVLPNMEEIIKRTVMQLMANQRPAQLAQPMIGAASINACTKQDPDVMVVRETIQHMPTLEPLQPMAQQPVPVPGVCLLPANDPRMGPAFELQGVSEPTLSFLNPSQLPQGGSSRQMMPSPSGTHQSRSKRQPVTMAQAPKRNEPMRASPSPSPRRKEKRSAEKEAKGRGPSKQRAQPSPSSSRDSSRDAKKQEYPELTRPAFPAPAQAKTPVPSKPRSGKKKPATVVGPAAPQPMREVMGPVVPQPMGEPNAEVVVSGLAQPSVNEIQSVVQRNDANYNQLLCELENELQKSNEATKK